MIRKAFRPLKPLMLAASLALVEASMTNKPTSHRDVTTIKESKMTPSPVFPAEKVPTATAPDSEDKFNGK